MQDIRYAIGVDISTQTVSAALVGVGERCGEPVEAHIDRRWRVSISYSTPEERKLPSAWVRLARHCVSDLLAAVPEARQSQGIGVSTTFPGTFAVASLELDPVECVLYDSTQDGGLLSGDFEDALSDAERDSLNRTWPGSMSAAVVHLVRDCGVDLRGLTALVPANTAFAQALLREAGFFLHPLDVGSDFTQTVIGGLYGAADAAPLPGSVRRLLMAAAPAMDTARLKSLLPIPGPSWANIVPPNAVEQVRKLFDLPMLDAVSIGAGDSALAVLPLCQGADAVVNVRGSSDTPVVLVKDPKPAGRGRESLLHYPVPAAADIGSTDWCAAAPILRTGRVWDWVRRLRFDDCHTGADAQLEHMAAEALARRLSLHSEQAGEELVFRTSLGGERAPSWDARAAGSITGLRESDTIGDVALAALEGVSVSLRSCIQMMETRCGRTAKRLVLAGGPTQNVLWNWVTEIFTGKPTYATAFSDASVLGAALLGYAAALHGRLDDARVSQRLGEIARLCSQHPLICPTRAVPPPGFSASLKQAYLKRAQRVLRAHGMNAAAPARS